jgi:hypothetical protein
MIELVHMVNNVVGLAPGYCLKPSSPLWLDNLRKGEREEEMRIEIQRRGDLRYETTVTLFQRGVGEWEIDPCEQVSRATGTRLSRHDCVVSFGYGLRDAGFDVLETCTTINGLHKYSRRFNRSERPVVLAYHFLGLAWGNNKWDQVRLALQCVTPMNRHAVLVNTAAYYLRKPWEIGGNAALRISL